MLSLVLCFSSHSLYSLLLNGLLGNISSVSTYFGSFDANNGILLEGYGNGTFSYVDQNKSGLNVNGEVRKIFFLDENKTKFVLGMNNDQLIFYKLNELWKRFLYTWLVFF